MITVNGTLTQVDGTPIVDDVLFELVDPKGIPTTATVDGAVIASRTIVTTNDSGVFTVDLYPNDSIVKDTKYKVSNGATDDIFYIFVNSLTNPVDIDELDGIIPRRTVPAFDAADVGKTLKILSTTEYGWSTFTGDGDMTKAVYDTNNNGKVDAAENSDTVNNLTVETAVPLGAVFTDTTYTDAEIKTKYESNLDTNAYTDSEKTKLAGIEDGAEVNVQSDWNAVSGDALILNKPTIPTVPTTVSSFTNDSGYISDITAESINDLSDVLIATPLDGQVLTYDPINGWQNETPASGVTDHTLLSNIGTNTHTQIDTHISDSTLHFTQESISITESQISDFGSYEPLIGYTSENVANKQSSVSGWQVTPDDTKYPTEKLVKDSLDLKSDTSHNHAGVYEPADATILKDADIGVNVQAYDANTAKLDVIQTFTAAQTIPLSINAQTGATYTAVLSDADKIITLDNAAAITMTIPANASVAYPIGTKLNFLQLGAGAVTIGITTDTLNYDSALTAVLNGQYAMATAVKVTSTSWVLFGNLAVA